MQVPSHRKLMEIALEAESTIKSVAKFFEKNGKNMQPVLANRIRKVAERHGYSVPTEAAE